MHRTRSAFAGARLAHCLSQTSAVSGPRHCCSGRSWGSPSKAGILHCPELSRPQATAALIHAASPVTFVSYHVCCNLHPVCTHRGKKHASRRDIPFACCFVNYWSRDTTACLPSVATSGLSTFGDLPALSASPGSHRQRFVLDCMISLWRDRAYE